MTWRFYIRLPEAVKREFAAVNGALSAGKSPPGVKLEEKQMAFTRKALAGLGLSEDHIEKVMALHGTSMADFIPKSELAERINSAVDDALKNAPAPNVEESEAYKTLKGEYEGFKAKMAARAEIVGAGVKEKFFEDVYAKLDPSKDIAEQLPGIREKYEEFFTPESQTETGKPPQFGAQVTGSMPKGQSKPTIQDVWFGNKKGD